MKTQLKIMTMTTQDWFPAFLLEVGLGAWEEHRILDQANLI
jgi:hypothetical protein